MKIKYKTPVGDCPKCGAHVVYSNRGADKNYITIVCVDDDYDGRTYMCHKCKSMVTVIDQNPQAVVLKNPALIRAQA